MLQPCMDSPETLTRLIHFARALTHQNTRCAQHRFDRGGVQGHALRRGVSAREALLLRIHRSRRHRRVPIPSHNAVRWAGGLELSCEAEVEKLLAEDLICEFSQVLVVVLGGLTE